MSDMEELNEKIARAMATESQYNFDHYADAALRAIDGDGYEISKKKNRQYYCWNSACSATSQEQPDCICWYDQGTGPLAHESPMIWRTKKLEEPRG